jgi:hypothetical protein
VGYLASRLLRSPGSYWIWLDGWLVDGFELVGGALCVAKGLSRRRGRGPVLLLGAALLAWSTGDIVLTVQSIGGPAPDSPSWPDLFYLSFYPLAYAGIAKSVRAQLSRMTAPIWLDAVVAGLGTATVCAGFAFHRILGLTGTDQTATIVNLVYPIGDLLLLGLVAGGATVVGSGRRLPWVLLSVGCMSNVLGDCRPSLAISWRFAGRPPFSFPCWRPPAR